MTETSSPHLETEPEASGNLSRRLGGAAKEPTFSSFRTLGSILFWVVAPLLIGAWLAQGLVAQPAVGIIRLNTDIWSGSAQFVIWQIEEAREDPSIKAVVLQLDSPGGEVVATQSVYLELQNLRQEMPVVSSLGGMATSGAYYMAMATDPVYAKPSSSVGNVGVWGYIPPDVGVNEVGRTEEGKRILKGDVAFEEASEVASAITPVPGGVGPMTITMLMKNTVHACKVHNKLI